jgi:EAL domain-containing protein (putative c-di-GMP-specific phosphodiesterase class I)
MQKINFYEALQQQQLHPYFQPIVTLATGKVSGLEVRVRWRTDSGKSLTAGHVLKAAVHAEESWTVDREMIKEAGNTPQILKAQFIPPLTITVNLSAHTATNEDSIANLDQLLLAGTIPSEYVKFELPYEAYCQASDIMHELIKDLTARGYGVILDHVDGTEFNLSNCNSARCAVKLHEDLVSTALDNPEHADKIRTIASLATRQGLSIMAEGLSRMEQIRFLRDMGCREAQGPLIARPNTLGILLPLLKRGRCW